MDDLEERLHQIGEVAGPIFNEDSELIIKAADRLRTYREALEKIAEGDHLEGYHGAVALQALKG